MKGLIIKKLFSIRNEIEHNELDYTNKEQCRDLLDTVWYFLKSTDGLVYTANTDIELCEDEENETNWIAINLKSPQYELVNIRGRVKKSFLTTEKSKDKLELENIKITQMPKELIYFEGNIVLNDKQKVLIAKKLFIDKQY